MNSEVTSDIAPDLLFDSSVDNFVDDYELMHIKEFLKGSEDEVLAALLDEDLLELFQDEMMNTLDEGLVNLSEKWKVQVVLIDENTQKMERCFPGKFSDDLPHIYLLKRIRKDHVDLICNIHKYYTQSEVRRRVCFHCQKETEISQIPHNCPVAGSCLSCRRRLRTNNTYVNEQNIETFCCSGFSPDLNEECVICQLPLLTLKCKKKHKCTSYNSGKKFLCCGKFFKINKNCPDRNSIESLTNSHERLGCNQRYCRTCYNCFVPDQIEGHHCRVKLQKIPTDSFINNTIACISLMAKNKHPNSGCNQCRLHENSIEIKYCPLHENDGTQYEDSAEAEYNMATLLVEMEKSVYKVQFADSDLSRLHNVSSETSRYELKEHEKDYTLPPQKRSLQKKKMKSPILNFLQKTNPNVCEKVVQKLLSSYLHVTVFATQIDLKAVLSTFLHNQIKPHTVLNESNIISLKVEDIKFVDVAQFITGPVMEATFDGCHQYFPEILNNTVYPFDVSKVPDLTHFLSLEDTQEITIKKTQYHSQLNLWNYSTALQSYSKYRCQVLFSGVKLMVNETATFVSNYQKALGGTFPNLNKLKVLHNTYNTVPSFLLDIFFLGANHEKYFLYNTPKKSVHSTSSHGEYAFAIYECHRLNLINPIHTYNNPKGQQYHYGMWPDLVADDPETEDGKLFFQYNGYVCRLTRGYQTGCFVEEAVTS